MNKVYLNKQFVQLFIHSSIFGFAWVAIAVSWVEVRSSWWPFGGALYIAVLGAWGYYLIKSLVLVFRNYKSLQIKSFLPLSILLLCLVIVISVDPVLVDFNLRFAHYARPIVLSLENNDLEVLTGQPPVEVDRNIPVARSIKMARDDRGTTIFFTRYTAGFGDRSVGYTYRSDDSESKIHNSYSGPIHRKIAAHWFWGIDPFDWSLQKPAF